MRFRFWSMLLGIVVVFALIIIGDPRAPTFVTLPFGAGVLMIIKIMAALSVAAFVVHYTRKTLFDYLDLSKFVEKAFETPLSAAVALVAVAIFVLAASNIFGVVVANLG